MKTSKFFRYRKLILPLIWLGLLALIIPQLSGLSVQEILNYTPASPFLAACALLLLYCLKAVVIGIPLTALYICAGIMFSPAVAILISLLGLILEFCIGYAIGKRFGAKMMDQFLEKKNKICQTVKAALKNVDTACLIFRILPGPLPLDVMSMVFGAAKMKFPRYLIISLIGIIPGMLPWVIAAGAIDNPLSAAFLLPFGVGIMAAVIFFVCMKRYEKKMCSCGV